MKENVKAEKKLFVDREIYTKDNKDYWQYFVAGVIKGKQIKAKLTAGDVGGYEVLDLVFIGNERAELLITPGTMKDEGTGKEISFVTYEAMTCDENGVVYKGKVKPLRPSDKALLEMLSNQ